MAHNLSKTEAKELKKELFTLLLKKTNLTKDDIVDDAITSFIADKLDMLTTQERSKYKSIII